MKKYLIIIVSSVLLGVFLLIPLSYQLSWSYAAEQVYVKADAVLIEKPAVISIVFTQKMKDDVLKLEKITAQNVKSIVQGSSSDAKRLIDEMLNEGAIKRIEDRYEELYPSNATP